MQKIDTLSGIFAKKQTASGRLPEPAPEHVDIGYFISQIAGFFWDVLTSFVESGLIEGWVVLLVLLLFPVWGLSECVPPTERWKFRRYALAGGCIFGAIGWLMGHSAGHYAIDVYSAWDIDYEYACRRACEDNKCDDNPCYQYPCEDSIDGDY